MTSVNHLAYLLHWNEGPHSGVFKKVVRQTRLWAESGRAVSIHVISRKPWEQAWRNAAPHAAVYFYPYQGFRSRWRAWSEAAHSLLALKPDLTYFRYDLFMQPLAALARDIPVVVEVNTDDYTEFCLQFGLRCLHNRLTRDRLFKLAAGVVFMTHELAASPYFVKFKKPQTVIANGIDLEAIPVTPPPENERPRLVFMGADGLPWHGVDKILWLARQRPTWRFDIIGGHEQDDPPPNVVFHGVLGRDAYGRILTQADAAIGSLAAHRKGMDEACPLKTREYLAFGLPVIAAYRDTDFPEGAPFLLQLPNTETNVRTSLDAIDAFVAAWRGRRVDRKALTHLDVRVKEAQRLAFFEDVLRTR